MVDALTRFRVVAIGEGISYVVLVFVGMPLKYLAGRPGTVEVVGWIHGVLFIAYMILLAMAAADEGWSKPFIGGAIAASLVPGGTFYLDGFLRGEDDETVGERADER